MRERERTLAWEQIQHCHLMSFASQDRSAHCIAKPHVCHIYIYILYTYAHTGRLWWRLNSLGQWEPLNLQFWRVFLRFLNDQDKKAHLKGNPRGLRLKPRMLCDVEHPSGMQARVRRGVPSLDVQQSSCHLMIKRCKVSSKTVGIRFCWSEIVHLDRQETFISWTYRSRSWNGVGLFLRL